MAKRAIRLKEHEPSSNGSHTPTDSYLAATNGTLPKVSYRWSSDANGFLETGVEAKDGPSVFILGGSYVESMFAQPNERFVARAARIVHATLHNAGYSGTTTLQQTLSLQAKVFPLTVPGDIVVLTAPKSDVNTLMQTGGYWSPDRLNTPLTPVSPRELRRPEGSVSQTGMLLRSALELATAFELRPVVSISPHYEGDFSYDAFLRRKFRRDRTRFNRVFSLARSLDETAREVAREARIPVVDFSKETEGSPDLFYDEWHLNGLFAVRGE